MKKRFLSVLMALALCMGLTAPAFAVNIQYATQEDIRSTFTILRNGMVDETKGVYTSSKTALLNLYSNGTIRDVETPYEVYDETDSWTITNTGSKAISVNGSTDYTISLFYSQYGDDPWDDRDALVEIGGSGSLGLDSDGTPHFVYGDGPEYPVVLKAGQSVTIPASLLGGNSAKDTIYEVSLIIFYGGGTGDEPGGAGCTYTFYFGCDPAEKAAIEKNLGNQPVPSFTDVPGWCAKEAQWAAAQGIAKGTGNNRFTPGRNCTHQEILTFLWRAADRPDPTATAPVTVAADYAGAVNWAYGEGMIDGSFNPKAPCTRADAVIYIWKACGELGADAHGFNDIPDGNEDLSLAVNFAAVCGISNGYDNGDGTFSFRPNKVCSRGEIVTLLYRAYGPGSGLAGNP